MPQDENAAPAPSQKAEVAATLKHIEDAAYRGTLRALDERGLTGQFKFPDNLLTAEVLHHELDQRERTAKASR